MTSTNAAMRVPDPCLTDLMRTRITRFLQSSSRVLGNGLPDGIAKILKKNKKAKRVKEITSKRKMSVELTHALHYRTLLKQTNAGSHTTNACMETRTRVLVLAAILTISTAKRSNVDSKGAKIYPKVVNITDAGMNSTSASMERDAMNFLMQAEPDGSSTKQAPNMAIADVVLVYKHARTNATTKKISENMATAAV